MNYEPAQSPGDDKGVREYLARELRRISTALRDDALVVAYETGPVNASLSAGVSANWKVPLGNLIRLSTSNTITLTGITERTPWRRRTFLNVGTGVVVFKSEGTESSASNRFALVADFNVSANGSLTLVYDAFSARHRGIART